MCCFSRRVNRVADTNIFARGSSEGRQFLVYSMLISAGEDLAMILPIPVPLMSKEDSVRFINLEKYPEFFRDLHSGFPPKVTAAPAGRTKSFAVKKAPLKVVDVGSFEASFVPTIKDFDRLDERFRLPADVWFNLPQYKDYGFVVFKLRKGTEQRVHPMAFEFPRAKPHQLFFPTVHIHDGKVHRQARFDHTLYCQSGPDEDLQIVHWEESPQPAGMFMKMNKAQGLIDEARHCYRRGLHGSFKNEDQFV
jgi:hypothetical protein